MLAAGAAPILFAAPLARAQVSRVEVPFQLRSNQPITRLTINGRGPYNFLIDTGARGFALTDTLATELNLAVLGQGTSQGAVGRSLVTVYQARAVFVEGGLRDRNVQMAALPAIRGASFQGLFPMPRGAAELGFDWERSRFIVDQRPPSEHAGYERMRASMETDVAVRGSRAGTDQSPRLQVRINGRPATLLIDTGAQGALFLKPDFVRANNLWDASPRFRDGASSGTAGAFRTRLAPLDSLEIGRFRFDELPATLGNPEDAGRDGWGEYDGLLGMEVLRRLNFFLKPRRDELWVRANRFLDDIYRYDRSGMSLAWRDDSVVITHVREGGPAARAGLKAEDVIAAAPAASLLALEALLTEQAGTPVPMTIRREGAAPRDVTVVLADAY